MITTMMTPRATEVLNKVKALREYTTLTGFKQREVKMI